MPNWVKYYKDRHLMLQRRNAERKRNYNKTSNIYEGKRRWTESEDKLVLAHVITDFELAGIIIRSVQAIQKRRWQLKKVSNK